MAQHQLGTSAIPADVQELHELQLQMRVCRERIKQLTSTVKESMKTLPARSWRTAQGCLRLRTVTEWSAITRAYLQTALTEILQRNPALPGPASRLAEDMVTFIWAHRPSREVERIERTWSVERP